MSKLRVILLAMLTIALLLMLDLSGNVKIVGAEGADYQTNPNNDQDWLISPIWGTNIHQWAAVIHQEALDNGLDPDLISAIILAESNGDQFVVSRVGAVGLMGVMPTGPGLEWRPAADELTDPSINLGWGVAILAEIIRQSGGDLAASLAAYSGGWDQANNRVPQQYARQVLNDYGRAVAVRSNISPAIASEWTIATEINRGHIPYDPLLLSERPLSGLQKYGEHVVYNYTDLFGRSYYVKGYAVPIALVVPPESPATSGSDTVYAQLMERLGMNEVKVSKTNLRVLQACLPSLSRLRGRLATRWFAPSGCPIWHR